MGKAPASQFYWNDYYRDTRPLTKAARGVWMDILCFLHFAPRRGTLRHSLPGWGGVTSCTTREFRGMLTQFIVADICHVVTHDNGDITLISRRMEREEKEKESTRLRSSRYRASRSHHDDIPKTHIPSSSSSSSSSSKQDLVFSEENIVRLPPDDLANGGRNYLREAEEVLRFLNEKTGRHYRPRESSGKPSVNLEHIVARLKTGATVTECRQVIAKKTREWQGDAKQNVYLRPATLFNRTKYEQYRGELLTEGS